MTKGKKFNRRNLPAEVRLSLKVSLAKKAEDIVVLDLRGLASFTDFFSHHVVVNSTRQNQAIYQAIEENLGKEMIFPLGIEGKTGGEWILMDYGHSLFIFSRSEPESIMLWKNSGAMHPH